MKFERSNPVWYSIYVAPARERGLKLRISLNLALSQLVAPARERGLKSCGQCLGCRLDKGRSREGAWIEIEDIFKLGFVTIKSLPRGSVD